MDGTGQGAKDVAEAFYQAFARKDGDAMAALYAPDATFTDPVFPGLDGRQAGQMWRMLVARGADLVVKHELREATADTARVHWEAWYTFSATGRKVHNRIDATLRVRDGRIVAHEDVFDFWAWSRQALGVTGVLLGWSSALRNKVRGGAREQLDRWLAKHA